MLTTKDGRIGFAGITDHLDMRSGVASVLLFLLILLSDLFKQQLSLIV